MAIATLELDHAFALDDFENDCQRSAHPGVGSEEAAFGWLFSLIAFLATLDIDIEADHAHSGEDVSDVRGVDKIVIPPAHEHFGGGERHCREGVSVITSLAAASTADLL